jgi:hypothetical protein
MQAARWSDNDRHFGPFTYARDRRGYRPLAATLDSGRAEDSDWHERGESTCTLRVSGFGHTLILALPQIVQPLRRWVDTKGPGSGYWDIQRRAFGFSYHGGFLQVFRGARTNDSSTDRTWSKHLPWTQWRHVRHSFYGLSGEHVATLPDTGKSYLGDPGRWDRARAIADATPAVSFAFRDFDGEELIATTKIEEREWRFGTGWFRWLSLFRRPKIRRSLDIRFSGETGRRKGSWKGGTIGHGIDMEPGELHEGAFRRYCAQHDMTFIGPSPGSSPGRAETGTGSGPEGTRAG